VKALAVDWGTPTSAAEICSFALRCDNAT